MIVKRVQILQRDADVCVNVRYMRKCIISNIEYEFKMYIHSPINILDGTIII